MTYAYAEIYLNDAMRNLGEAFDYAFSCCGFSLDEFMKLFIATGYADNFGKGNPRVVSGMSGTELVMEVVNKSGLKMDFSKAKIEYDFSPEYWCGWILAYYQWYTTRTFKDINIYVSMEEILKMYGVMHEVSEEKFVETLNSIIRRKKTQTKLQYYRKQCQYTQSELSIKSGVNLRTLQQYEIGSKDINKASVKTIISLSNVLGCKVEDLLE